MHRPSFKNDYSEGALPEVLQLMTQTNLEGIDGYSTDPYCEKAREMVRAVCGREDADVHFIVGGTQCNTIAIAHFLRPHQAVIAADSGHINTHETGAIEATGHKVLYVVTEDGKLTPDKIKRIAAEHGGDEHMVQPAMVYVSNTTEVGTLYNKAELTAISQTCKELGLIFYLDGARLASALTSAKCDLTMADVADLTDAFYVGATKNGGLFGEAMVITNPALKKDFRYMLKQRGALLAKGWLLGLQFIALFEDDRWYTVAKHANALAEKLAAGIVALEEKGAALVYEQVSNQVFISLPCDAAEKLAEKHRFEWWGLPENGRRALRLVTNWATPESRVDALLCDLDAILSK